VLAPVLARLDALPGVTAARVDSSGRFFWLSVADGADIPGLTALAQGVLEGGAHPLPAARAAAQLEAWRRGDPWLGSREAMTLSFVESRLLSVRIAGEALRNAGAGSAAEHQEELAEGLRSELFAAMERVHAEGGRKTSGWIYQAWPAIAAAALARCAPALPSDLRVRLVEVLPRLLAR
jgi:hypothetical protein